MHHALAGIVTIVMSEQQRSKTSTKILAGVALTGAAAFGAYLVHRHFHSDDDFTRARAQLLARKRRQVVHAPPISTITVDSDYEYVHNEREARMRSGRAPSVSVFAEPLPSRSHSVSGALLSPVMSPHSVSVMAPQSVSSTSKLSLPEQSPKVERVSLDEAVEDMYSSDSETEEGLADLLVDAESMDLESDHRFTGEATSNAMSASLLEDAELVGPDLQNRHDNRSVSLNYDEAIAVLTGETVERSLLPPVSGVSQSAEFFDVAPMAH